MKLKQTILTITCLLILLIPNITCMMLSTDLTYSWVKEVGYLVVVLFLLLLPMSFLKRRTYFIVEGVLGLFWMPIEVSSLYLNHITSSPHFIGLIFRTNWIEAQEVLLSAWPILVIVIGLWGIYIFMVCQMENRYLFPKWCKWIGAGILVLIIGGGCGIQPITYKLAKIYPYNIYFNLFQIWQEERLINSMNQEFEGFSFGLSQPADSCEEHLILMIGEAARYDHFHINNYSRFTSPTLDTLSDLFSLQRIYTSANITYSVLAQLLTRATIDNPSIAFQEKSIVEAYQEAGFQTAWFSCQTFMDFVTRIARTCDYSSEQIGGLSAKVAYDSLLAYQAQQCLMNHPAKKTFYVLHSMGSHIKYDQRYPKEFEQFVPAIEEKDGYSILSVKNKEKVINAYDNTILYTDYVIGRIIQVLQQQTGRNAFIYISDHGENLFDDEQGLFAHASYEGTIYEAHVPCFIWLSDEFKKAYPKKVAALEENLNKQIQSDIIFYSLADMGRLDEIVEPTKSIFSSELIEQDTIRMITGDGQVKPIIP